MHRIPRLFAALGFAVVFASPSPSAQTKGGKLPRTPDGHPDLQGIWDFRSATPLERPARFAGREFMTPDEVVEYERLALEREDGRPPDDARSPQDQSVHPVWWLDYGKKVVKTARTSLIVDPPDGKIPAMTEAGKERVAARRAEARTHGPADSYENRSLFERCLTRGVPDGMLPGPYNNNMQLLQTPGHVVIFTEMIHDARVIPMDGRPHTSPTVRAWMGDSRGRWDGDTLVVDTLNFTDKTNFRGSGANLHLVERFTRVDRDTLEYRFTVDDPTTWTRSWTVAYPMVKAEGPIYDTPATRGTTASATSSRARGGKKSTRKKPREKTVAAPWRRSRRHCWMRCWSRGPTRATVSSPKSRTCPSRRSTSNRTPRSGGRASSCSTSSSPAC